MGDEAAGDRYELARQKRLDGDPDCGKNILRAWKKMRREHRPLKARKLLQILQRVYQNPYPSFMNQQTVADIDLAFASFSRAVKNLAKAVPPSADWDVLPYVMERRASLGDEGACERYFEKLHADLAFLADVPALRPRIWSSVATEKEMNKQSTRGRQLEKPYIRAIVYATCWYIVNEEGSPFVLSFDREEAPSSRSFYIVEATLQGMGLSPERDLSAIGTALRAAKSIDWANINFWDLIPAYPPLFAGE